MIQVTHRRSVLNDQILPGLLAGPARTFHVGGDDGLETDLALLEEAIGRFEFTPNREGLRQGAARILG
jgi:hypothetical protein